MKGREASLREELRKIASRSLGGYSTKRTFVDALADDVIDLMRATLEEIALSFDGEAATHYELAEVARARQAEAAATYVRIVRDTKFPVK